MKAVIINRPLKAENLWEGLRWLRAEKTPNGETAGRLQSDQEYHNCELTSYTAGAKGQRGETEEYIIKNVPAYIVEERGADASKIFSRAGKLSTSHVSNIRYPGSWAFTRKL